MIEESDSEARKKDEGAEIKLKAQKSKQKIPPNLQGKYRHPNTRDIKNTE